MSAAESLPEQWHQLLDQCTLRAGSLAVTIFGDTIALQGQRVWLNTLVQAMKLFALNDRQIRTALFRLVQDGWLSSSQQGRRSLYQFSPHGLTQFTQAAERIYATQCAPWDGIWTLVMDDAVPAGKREQLKKQLGWAGFGMLRNGFFAHPNFSESNLVALLDELEIDEAIVWQATTEQLAPLLEVIAEVWDFAALGRQYDSFLSRFDALQSARWLGLMQQPATAFVLRTLLIHEYRRLLLRSVEMPAALLPADWCGHRAAQLVADVYRQIHAAATAYSRAVLANDDGPLKSPEAAFYQRFGGLKAATPNEQVA